MKKLAIISTYYPLFFAVTKLNLGVIFVIMPLVFIYGNWIVSGIYLLFFAIFLYFERLYQPQKVIVHSYFLILLIFVAGVNAAFRTVESIEGFMYFNATVLLPIIAFISITNSKLSIKNINGFINVNIISGIVLGIFSLYIVLILGSPGYRISSFWEDFNIVAAYFMIIIFFIITKIIHSEDKRLTTVYLIALVPVMLGLFFTQTRGVWLSVIVALVFYVLKRPKALVPASILFGFVMIFFYSIVLDRFLSVRNFTTDLSSLGRIQAWVASVILIKDHWLFGSGFDSFMELRYTVFDYYIVDVPHSHNTYLRLILEMGIFGFLPYISIMLIAFYYTFKLTKIYKNNKSIIKIVEALQLSFVGLFISFMFEPYFSLYGNSCLIIWILIAVTFYLYKNKELKENFKS